MTTEYERYAHIVQTAIAFNPDKTAQEPKHLRTGIDTSKADMAGLAALLIAKGVFTLAEYEAALAQSMKDEAVRQHLALAAEMGMTPDQITLE